MVTRSARSTGDAGSRGGEVIGITVLIRLKAWLVNGFVIEWPPHQVDSWLLYTFVIKWVPNPAARGASSDGPSNGMIGRPHSGPGKRVAAVAVFWSEIGSRDARK